MKKIIAAMQRISKNFLNTGFRRQSETTALQQAGLDRLHSPNKIEIDEQLLSNLVDSYDRLLIAVSAYISPGDADCPQQYELSNLVPVLEETSLLGGFVNDLCKSIEEIDHVA